MDADIARLSFDPTRDYRALITQQGRVTLEADSNEASTIASEALRLETIDVVGPSGTPDGGYAVSAGRSPTDLVIGAGTIYVGGWRLTLDAPMHLNQQPDWLNQTPTAVPQGDTLVALLVTEQSVGAVEDQALLEVALGGPDSAARARLMQHFLALPTSATTCQGALGTLQTTLGQNGLSLDTDTCAVTSTATLEVSFFPPPAPADPCCPPASGGYLGADNQLVRVTVIRYNPTSGSGTLLWGWNNASTLFRATVIDQQTLALSPGPVDAAHTPQQGQAIEVLRTECVLGNPSDQNYVAAPQGQVMTLSISTAVFNSGNNQLSLPGTLPPDYGTEPNSLFVRLWQAQVTFQSGVAQQLDPVSGLAVTINLSAVPSGPFITARPVWQIAVRPNTPQQVYPQRYLQNPQPPDGPRQWLCDLAVVSVGATGFTLLQDCLNSFQPLIDQQPCESCGVTLGPKDVAAAGGLQAVIDAQASAGAGQGATVTLLPGLYVLPAPLALTAQHQFLTIEGCGANAVLSADPNALTSFTPGLITIKDATGVTLQNLSLTLPNVLYRVTWPNGQTINSTDSTPQAPALRAFNNLLYVFWKANDKSNRIYYSASSTGAAGSWPAGQPIDGTDSTPDAPAACVFNGLLYLFWKANDSSNSIYFSTSSDGKTWAGGQRINSTDSTPEPVAVCVFNNQLVLFWKANDSSNRLYYSASSNGKTWPGGQLVDSIDSTPNAPAVCVLNNQLVLFWRANDSSNQIYYSTSTTLASWPKGQVIDTTDLTSDALAACVFGNQIYLFWKDSANRLMFSSSSNGTTWAAGQTINSVDTSAHTPAVTVFNNAVYLVWQGNTSNAMYTSAVAPPSLAGPLVLPRGVCPTDATNLTLENCTLSIEVPSSASVIGACVFAQGACAGLRLLGNQFECSSGGAESATSLRFVIGLWLTPAATGAATFTGTEFKVVNPAFSKVNQVFDDAHLVGNTFTGLTLPIIVIAQIGLVRCTENRVTNSCAGFWFLEADMGSNLAVNRAALADEEANNANAKLANTIRVSTQPTVLEQAMTYSAAFGSSASAAPSSLSDEVQRVLKSDYTTRGSAAYTAFISELTPAAAGTGTSAAAGTAPAAASARLIDESTYKATSTALDTLQIAALAAESEGTTLEPTIYLLHNDLELVPLSSVTRDNQAQPSLPGLMTICTQGELIGSLFYQGNRVEVPTKGSMAMVSYWAAKTIITGNQFYQAAGKDVSAPCMVAVTDNTNFFSIMGNIVHQGWIVSPVRSVPTGLATSDWAYLNTVG